MNYFKTTGLALALTGLLGACAEDGQGGFANPISDIAAVTGAGGSQAQRQLSSIQREYASVRLQAAGGVAAAALLYCAIQSCSVRERNQRIAAGLVAGYLVGGYLTNRDADFQGTQQTLQKDIQVAQQDNARLSRSVAAAKNVVTFQRQQIATLNRGLSQGTTSVAQYRAEIAQMQRDVQSIQKIRSDGAENVAGLNRSISNHSKGGQSTSALVRQRDEQVARLNDLRREERRMLDTIASAPAEVRA